VIVTPGFTTDAVHDTTIDPLPGATVTPVGEYGRSSGVTAADGADAAPLPALFDATTVNVYAVPFVRPVTLQVSAPVVVHVLPPGEEVTVYPVIGVPPFEAGASHETITFVSPELPVTPVGAPGTTSGITALDTATGESPAVFVAFTEKVYDVPFVRPEHAAVTPVTTHDPPVGDEVTEYDVIGVPPLDTGAVHDTDADAFPLTALTDVGAFGATFGVTRTVWPETATVAEKAPELSPYAPTASL
jgi:hypothetical protein